MTAAATGAGGDRMTELIPAIDIGTTSVRAGVIGTGRRLHAGFSETCLTARPASGLVEQDSGDWLGLIDRAPATLTAGGRRAAIRDPRRWPGSSPKCCPTRSLRGSTPTSSASTPRRFPPIRRPMRRFLTWPRAGQGYGMTMGRRGEPRAGAALVGVLVQGVRDNGLTQIAVDSYVREILTGAIVLCAVALSSISRAR